MERRVRDVEKGMQSILNEISSIRENYPVTQAALLVENAPEPVAVTKTDADGRFTVRLYVGKDYIFYAHSDRRVGSATEHYAWVIKTVALKKPSDRIVLSNDNLAGVDSSAVSWARYALTSETACEQIAKITLR